LAVLFSIASYAQRTPAPRSPDPEPARTIGQAVLKAAEHYEQETGKPASLIVIHLAGKLPSPESTSPPKPGLNQYHYGFTLEVQDDPGNSSSSQALRQRYGQPIAETFLIRPDITVTATYGPSGKTCELVISPKPSEGLVKSLPGPGAIDDTVMKSIEDELVPASERGKFKIGGFFDVVGCMESCPGAEEDWDNVVIVAMYKNVGEGNSRYETIQWHRDECGLIVKSR